MYWSHGDVGDVVASIHLTNLLIISFVIIDSAQIERIQKDISSVGVEPTTLGLLDPRSNQLSYEDLVTMVVDISNCKLIQYENWKSTVSSSLLLLPY